MPYGPLDIPKLLNKRTHMYGHISTTQTQQISHPIFNLSNHLEHANAVSPYNPYDPYDIITKGKVQKKETCFSSGEPPPHPPKLFIFLVLGTLPTKKNGIIWEFFPSVPLLGTPVSKKKVWFILPFRSFGAFLVFTFW